MSETYCLTVNEEQLRALGLATELLSRVMMGQIESVTDPLEYNAEPLAAPQVGLRIKHGIEDTSWPQLLLTLIRHIRKWPMPLKAVEDYHALLTAAEALAARDDFHSRGAFDLMLTAVREGVALTGGADTLALRDILRLLSPLATGLAGGGRYHGIRSEAISDLARASWAVYQVVRPSSRAENPLPGSKEESAAVPRLTKKSEGDADGF